MNPIVLSVAVVLIMAALRINVVLAIVTGAFVGGLGGGMDFRTVLQAFSEGIGGGAGIGLSYALLGAFAMGLSRSGIPDFCADKVVRAIRSGERRGLVKWSLLITMTLMAVASQNIVPVHIAFIPLVIPPLLAVFDTLALDRRAIACCLTFGLTATYMLLPVGFGNIYLLQILASNLIMNGLLINEELVPQVMIIPVLGMFTGLLVALLWSYRRPRVYRQGQSVRPLAAPLPLSAGRLLAVLVAVVATACVQILTESMIVGAAVGCLVLLASAAVPLKEADNAFIDGMKMMAYCAFVMVAASGFAEVLRATGKIDTLVTDFAGLFVEHKAMAVLMLLVVGLLITMGIGSSFSTVPIIATFYVPLGMKMGLSPMAIAALVGTAGALGDAGSPASESTIGPTAGLNSDGQHDHIRDSVLPTFLHFNIPLVLFGWLAVMVL